MSVVVRPAVVEDGASLGRVHVQAWQAAYQGIMPQGYLDGLDPAQRGEQWRRRLAAPDPQTPTLVATVDGQIAGFASYGPARITGPAGARPVQQAAGELYAINVRPDHWQRGVGRALLTAATAGLAERGFDRAVLWVAAGNQRARAVYEHYGWQPDGSARTEEVFGVTVDEVRYHRPVPPPAPAG
ncbi:MAG TPA: GNAT family N-acetyltransferase [Mycobacteriales bacterium]|nr:GNAT family N-acetyltransferase [Mycobacteriales bacterium]